MKDVNACAAAIAAFAQTVVEPPQLLIVIVSDPTLAAYRSNIVGGIALMPKTLRELADKMETMGVIDLNASSVQKPPSSKPEPS